MIIVYLIPNLNLQFCVLTKQKKKKKLMLKYNIVHCIFTGKVMKYKSELFVS